MAVTFATVAAPIKFHHSTFSVKKNFSLSNNLTPTLTLTLNKHKSSSSSSLNHNQRRSLTITMYGKASTSYANALADIGKTSNNLDSIASDLDKIDKLFSDPSIYSFFTNPIILDDVKRSVIDEIASSANLQPDIANFLNVLLDANRFNIIKDIIKDFDLAYNELTGTELAVVKSVIPLESQQLAQIAKEVQKLTNAKNVRIKTEIDESLVAGFVVKYGPTLSSMIDMSVKKQLEEIAAELEVPAVQLATAS